MANIHPTAVVDAGAELAGDVEVGPLCYVGPDVTLGESTRLISQATILGPTTLGCANTLWPHATLGGDPQDSKYQGGPSRLVIGDHNHIRECVTIHRGTETATATTQIGSHNFLMAYAHVAHDCVVGNHVVIANSVNLGGHVSLEDRSTIGGSTAIHPFVTVGQYAYIGGCTRVVRDVPPYMIFGGNPATVRSVNSIGLGRNGFDEQSIEHLRDAYRCLFKNSASRTGAGQTAEMLIELEKNYPSDAHISRLIRSIRSAEEGVHGRYREVLRSDDRLKRKHAS